MQKEKLVHTGKTKIWIGSVMAALITAIAVFFLMLQTEKNMLSRYEKKDVYVASQMIPRGILITQENYEEYFERKELDADMVVPAMLSFGEQSSSMASVYDIDKGTVLTEAMFERVNEITKGMAEPVIAGCKADDLYQTVGGVLRPGDRIHIYGVDEENKVELLWSDVYVQQVFNHAGVTIEPGDGETAAQRLNLYMDKQDVGEFYSRLTAGTLRVVKVCE